MMKNQEEDHKEMDRLSVPKKTSEEPVWQSLENDRKTKNDMTMNDTVEDRQRWTELVVASTAKSNWRMKTTCPDTAVGEVLTNS